MPVYKVRQKSTGKIVQFNWNRPTMPTKAELRDIFYQDQFSKVELPGYKLPEIPKPPTLTEPDYSGRYNMPLPDLKASTTSFLPETGTDIDAQYLPLKERVGRYAYERLIRPTASPLGLATLPAGFVKGMQAPLAVAGSIYSASQVPEAASRAIQEPSLENISDVGLVGLGATTLPFVAKSLARPKPIPRPKPLEPITNPSRLLPEHSQTPRFYGGEVGLADITQGPNPVIHAQSSITIPKRPAKVQNIYQDYVQNQAPQYVRSTSYKEITNQINDRIKKVSERVEFHPELRDAVNTAGILITKGTSTNPGAALIAQNPSQARDLWNSFLGASIESELPRLIGKEGYQLIKKRTHLTRQANASIVKSLAEFKSRLTTDEQANLFDFIEGKAQPLNDNVTAAANLWKPIAKELGENAVRVGLEMSLGKGKKGPFIPLGESYIPRRLPKEAIANQKSFIDKLVAEGYTVFEAKQIYAKAKQFGELFLPAQHQRRGAKFEYRKDIDAMIEHVEGLNKQIIERELFGPKKKILSDLVKNSPDPERAFHLVQETLREADKPYDARLLKKVNDFARTTQATFHLQTFAIKNLIGGQFQAYQQTTTRNMLRTYMDLMTKRKEMGLFEDLSGATWNINKSVFEGMMQEWSMKYYGGRWSENFNRKIAAWTGRGEARQVFIELKQNPQSLAKRSWLEELLLENADDILKQDKLTPKQELMAGGRFSEISQGLNVPERTPYIWSKEWAQLPLIFRKYSFQQTKELKNSIKRNPANLAKFIALAQVSGTMIGGVRSSITETGKALVKGEVPDYGKAFEERSEYMGRYTRSDNWWVNFLAANMTENWLIGITSDLVEGIAGGPMSFLKSLGGPFINQVATVIGSAGRIPGDIAEMKTIGLQALGREALRSAPIPILGGTGLQRGLLPSPYQEKSSRGRAHRRRRTR